MTFERVVDFSSSKDENSNVKMPTQQLLELYKTSLLET